MSSLSVVRGRSNNAISCLSWATQVGGSGRDYSSLVPSRARPVAARLYIPLLPKSIEDCERGRRVSAWGRDLHALHTLAQLESDRARDRDALAHGSVRAVGAAHSLDQCIR